MDTSVKARLTTDWCQFLSRKLLGDSRCPVQLAAGEVVWFLGRLTRILPGLKGQIHECYATYALVCVESWEYIVGAAMNEIFQLYIQALLEGNVNQEP